LALSAAHARGLVHRDVKPANLWLEAERGRVKVLDFGLARQTGDPADLSQPGMLLGTPAYLAPERAAGREGDPRGDLFSLGCVLSRACTGGLPSGGEGTMATLLAVTRDPPRPPHQVNPAVPRALSDLVLRLLAKSPAGRPASAQAVVEAITAIERAAG